MASVGIGDMSQTFLNSRNINSVKTRLYSLNSELNTGRVSDLSRNLGGQTSVVDGLDRDLQLLDRFEQTNGLLAASLDRQQLTLTSINDMRTNMVGQFLSLTPDSLDTEFDLAASRARGDMSTIVSQLNLRDAGRAVFSGVAVDTNPLVDAETMLTDIVGLIGGATDSATIITTIETWFDAPGGGFDTLGYLGDTGDAQQRQISQTEVIELKARADDPAYRSLLKGVAIAAISDALPFDLANDVQADLMRQSSEELLSASAGLVNVQADIGYNQERVELAQSAQAAKRASLSVAHNNLVLADPYETATKLQEVQRQLEMQFTTTARLSQLSLVNFI